MKSPRTEKKGPVEGKRKGEREKKKERENLWAWRVYYTPECKLTYLVPRSDGNRAGKFER